MPQNFELLELYSARLGVMRDFATVGIPMGDIQVFAGALLSMHVFWGFGACINELLCCTTNADLLIHRCIICSK